MIPTLVLVSAAVRCVNDRLTRCGIGEGHFDDSSKPSGAATPVETAMKTKRKGVSKKAKSIKEKLAIADGAG